MTMPKPKKSYKKRKPILYVLNGWNRYKASHDFTDWFAQQYPDLKSAILCQSEMFNYAEGKGLSVSVVVQKLIATPSL